MATPNVNVETNNKMLQDTTLWMQQMQDMRTEFMGQLKTVQDELAHTKEVLAQTQAKTQLDKNEEHEKIFNDRVNGRPWVAPTDWTEERIAVVHTVGYNQRTCV